MGKKYKRSCQKNNHFVEFERSMQQDLSKLEAQTESQHHYMQSIYHNKITFATGPAGTGKTFLATAIAAEMIREKKLRNFIITRPAVEAEESLGFLPGEIEDKYAPYFRPVRHILDRRLGESQTSYLIKNKQIEAMPLAYMRGNTIEDCFVLFDEAQNATKKQMKLFLTRVGENCRVVVNGDITQRDVECDGIEDAIMRTRGIAQVNNIEFDELDVVRSGMAAHIVKAYTRYDAGWV